MNEIKRRLSKDDIGIDRIIQKLKKFYFDTKHLRFYFLYLTSCIILEKYGEWKILGDLEQTAKRNEEMEKLFQEKVHFAKIPINFNKYAFNYKKKVRISFNCFANVRMIPDT